MPGGRHLRGVAPIEKLRQNAGRALLARSVFFCVGLALPALALAALSQPSQAPSAPLVRKVAPHRYQVGEILIDARAGTVRCHGRVNMSEGGPIELLACLPRGKTHESVFTMDPRPKNLQLALLLLDLKPGRNPAVKRTDHSPEPAIPPGDKVNIFVRWRPAPRAPADTGQQENAPAPKMRQVRAERFLYNIQADTPLGQADWVFLGSQFVEGRFGADIEGSIITTFHDPLAILELAHPTVNDDIYYCVNKRLCPPIGTPVELIIKKPKPKLKDKGSGRKDEH